MKKLIIAIAMIPLLLQGCAITSPQTVIEEDEYYGTKTVKTAVFNLPTFDGHENDYLDGYGLRYRYNEKYSDIAVLDFSTIYEYVNFSDVLINADGEEQQFEFGKNLHNFYLGGELGIRHSKSSIAVPIDFLEKLAAASDVKMRVSTYRGYTNIDFNLMEINAFGLTAKSARGELPAFLNLVKSLRQ